MQKTAQLACEQSQLVPLNIGPHRPRASSGCRLAAGFPPHFPALRDEDPVVRGHAAWAIAQMAPRDASLEPALRRESDERVRAELQRALDT